MLFQLVLSSLCFTLIVLFCYISARCTSSSYCDVIDGSLHYSLNVLLCIIPLYFVLPNLSKYIYTIIIIIITLTTARSVWNTHVWTFLREDTRQSHWSLPTIKTIMLAVAWITLDCWCLQFTNHACTCKIISLETSLFPSLLSLVSFCFCLGFFFLSHPSFLFLSTRQRRLVSLCHDHDDYVHNHTLA